MRKKLIAVMTAGAIMTIAGMPVQALIETVITKNHFFIKYRYSFFLISFNQTLMFFCLLVIVYPNQQNISGIIQN